MSNLIRCITSNGEVVAMAIDSTEIVAMAEQYHETSAVVTAALGRLLTAGSMMGNMLKGDKDTLTLRMSGDGPLGTLIVAADSSGYVRGYPGISVVELPLNPVGKLDVSGAIGKTGTLYVIKDLGLKEPYCGTVPFTSGEVAEDITAYYGISEQTPTVCSLGVLVNPDLTVRAAGGYIIQLLPAASDETVSLLEKSVAKMKPITTLIDEGLTPLEILQNALEGFEVEVLYETDTKYHCNCCKERVERALISLGKDELDEMSEEMKEDIEVKCHFCDKVYSFSKTDINKLKD